MFDRQGICLKQFEEVPIPFKVLPDNLDVLSFGLPFIMATVLQMQYHIIMAFYKGSEMPEASEKDLLLLIEKILARVNNITSRFKTLLSPLFSISSDFHL